jgi:hypothetical protein
MQLALTDDEAVLLRELLQGVLPDLRREVARTEAKALRHQLVLREELAERLLSQLPQAGA